MNKALRIFLILLIFVVLAVVGVSVYVAVNGRGILLSELEKNLGVKAQVGSLKILFPDTIVAEDVKLSETLGVKRVEVTPSLLGLLSGNMVFNAIILDGSQATITRNPDNSFDFGLGQIEVPHPARLGGKKKPLRFYVNKLNIRDSRVTFVDKGLADGSASVIRCLLDLECRRPSLLQILRMQFKGQGRLTLENGDPLGLIFFDGWVEPLARNMDAEAVLSEVRLSGLRPYYKKYFKKEVKSGDVGLTIRAASKDNDLLADCHLELARVKFKEPETAVGIAQEPVKGAFDFASLAADSFLSRDGGLALDFSVRTKMDRPRFENLKVRGDFFKNRVEAVFTKPPEEAIRDIKNIGKEFQEIGKQFKEIFKSK
jgi:hypothetical protein